MSFDTSLVLLLFSSCTIFKLAITVGERDARDTQLPQAEEIVFDVFLFFGLLYQTSESSTDLLDEDNLQVWTKFFERIQYFFLNIAKRKFLSFFWFFFGDSFPLCAIVKMWRGNICGNYS